jgi:outer membrane receptor for ferrienterochelin and colicins
MLNNLRRKIMKKAFISMHILIFACSISAIGQLRTLEGTVRDDKGNTIQGVKVEAEGTKILSSTNENGYYKIDSVPNSVLSLRFSYPDMEDASATVGLYNTIDVKMTKVGTENMYDISLEDLLNMEVTTASKKAEKNIDAPGIISTITKEEIKYFGANNLNDVLERATSIQTIGSHLWPNNISAMRGDLRSLYDNHTLLLINGRPIRDGVTGGVNYPIYLGLPVEMIEKIEIIRGPGSVLYGSNAFTSVINIITKDNGDKNSIRINGTAGSFGTMGGSVHGAYAKNDFKAKVNVNLDNLKGWDYSAITVHPDPSLPNLPIDKKYGRQNTGLAADLSYKGLSFTGFYTFNNQEIVGIIPYASWEGKNKMSRLFLNLSYTHKISDAWEASLNLTHNSSDWRVNDEAIVPFDHQENSDNLAELTVNGSLLENLNLVVGGVIDTRNKNNIGPNDAIPIKYNQTHLSAYIQADYRPIEILKLIVGAQLNKPNVGDIDIVPRVGAIFNFTDNFGVKTLYASAFRSPWPIEQFLDNPNIVGNPNLEPEKISTLDIQLFYSSKKAEGSITYFNSLFTNSVTRGILDSVFTYINQGELHMNGFELEGKVTISSNIFIKGSATIQNNADEETVAVYTPKFMGKIGAFYKTNFGLTAGIYNTYFGKPKENNGAIVNPEATGMDLISINLIYKLPISLPLEFSVYAQNLLNSTYHYTEFSRNWVNTLPMQPGAGIYGKINLTF